MGSLKEPNVKGAKMKLSQILLVAGVTCKSPDWINGLMSAESLSEDFSGSGSYIPVSLAEFLTETESLQHEEIEDWLNELRGLWQDSDNHVDISGVAAIPMSWSQGHIFIDCNKAYEKVTASENETEKLSHMADCEAKCVDFKDNGHTKDCLAAKAKFELTEEEAANAEEAELAIDADIVEAAIEAGFQAETANTTSTTTTAGSAINSISLGIFAILAMLKY